MILKEVPILFDISLNGAKIEGDKNSVVFTDFTDESQFELTWPEIWQACADYRER